MTTIMPDRAAFQQWAEGQPRGRFERLAGEVIPMPLSANTLREHRVGL